MKEIEVRDTSLDYEDFADGNIESEYRSNTLAEFFGESITPVNEIEAEKLHNYQNWREHWKGMPEFESENKMPAKQIIVSFVTEEDYQAFAKLVDQKLTKKTKSIWYPKKERAEVSLLRWVDEDANK